MGFSWREYWNGLPFPPLGDLPEPGIEPASPLLAADSLPLSHLGSPLLINLLLPISQHFVLYCWLSLFSLLSFLVNFDLSLFT